MATALEIQHISEQILKELAPQKIILFGSLIHGAIRIATLNRHTW